MCLKTLLLAYIGLYCALVVSSILLYETHSMINSTGCSRRIIKTIIKQGSVSTCEPSSQASQQKINFSSSEVKVDSNSQWKKDRKIFYFCLIFYPFNCVTSSHLRTYVRCKLEPDRYWIFGTNTDIKE